MTACIVLPVGATPQNPLRVQAARFMHAGTGTQNHKPGSVLQRDQTPAHTCTLPWTPNSCSFQQIRICCERPSMRVYDRELVWAEVGSLHVYSAPMAVFAASCAADLNFSLAATDLYPPLLLAPTWAVSLPRAHACATCRPGTGMHVLLLLLLLLCPWCPIIIYIMVHTEHELLWGITCTPPAAETAAHASWREASGLASSAICSTTCMPCKPGAVTQFHSAWRTRHAKSCHACHVADGRW